MEKSDALKIAFSSNPLLANSNNGKEKAEYVSCIIEALEKQIPMKPTGNYPFYCPVCEAKLMPDPHCGMCGQAIDWKEVSDETETSDT